MVSWTISIGQHNGAYSQPRLRRGKKCTSFVNKINLFLQQRFKQFAHSPQLVRLFRTLLRGAQGRDNMQIPPNVPPNTVWPATAVTRQFSKLNRTSWACELTCTKRCAQITIVLVHLVFYKEQLVPAYQLPGLPTNWCMHTALGELSLLWLFSCDAAKLLTVAHNTAGLSSNEHGVI